MIQLTNIDNKVNFECKVTGYQFPEIADDNWCFLNVIVTQGQNKFETSDPALEVNELKDIHEWFSSLSERQLPKYAGLTFTEPCISFEFLSCKNDIVRISITLSHELMPNFKLEQFKSEQPDWCLVFDLNMSDFKAILNGLETTMNRYPIRGVS